MAKFYGKIGYGLTGEPVPGVWQEMDIEKDVVGDWLKNTRQLIDSNKVNDDIKVNNIVSIVADPYATEHFQFIKYIQDGRSGVKWKVTNVEVQFPRLLLTLGGVYNAQ